jgi:enoyl-CoA hydratase/carnithine racemase
MSCHLKVASDNAKMGFARSFTWCEVTEEHRLPQLVGKGRQWNSMTAGMIDAETAKATD